MRHLLIIPLLLASPAAACGMDGMFGFNHYSDLTDDAAAATAMREAAIAEARDKFMTRYGIADGADAQNSASTGTTVVADSTVDGAPQ